MQAVLQPLQIPVAGETVSPKQAECVGTPLYLTGTFEAGKKSIPLSKVGHSGSR